MTNEICNYKLKLTHIKIGFPFTDLPYIPTLASLFIMTICGYLA